MPWRFARPSAPTAPFGRSPTSPSTTPRSRASSTTRGSRRRAATASRGASPWSNDSMLRHELAMLMQPVWDEYMETAAVGGNPFNVVDYVKPDDITPNKPNDLLDQHRDDPGRTRRRRRLVEAGDDGRRTRPGTDHRRRIDLSVLLEPDAVGPRPRPRRRDDHLPQPSRAGGRAGARPPRAPRVGHHDLPRPPRAPADQAEAQPGRVVRDRRSFRRPVVRVRELLTRRRWRRGPRRRSRRRRRGRRPSDDAPCWRPGSRRRRPGWPGRPARRSTRRRRRAPARR